MLFITNRKHSTIQTLQVPILLTAMSSGIFKISINLNHKTFFFKYSCRNYEVMKKILRTKIHCFQKCAAQGNFPFSFPLPKYATNKMLDITFSTKYIAQRPNPLSLSLNK